MKSKGYNKFVLRLNSFQEDIELADIFYKQRESIAAQETIFKGITDTYPMLRRRDSSTYNRKLVINHLKHTLYVALIKEIYEEVMIYFSYTLRCGAMTSGQPKRFVGSENSVNLSANDILSIESHEKLIERVMMDIFRRLENKKDTLLIINEINKRLDLGVKEETIKAAMPYLDARHKFVHADGLADDKYKTDYPNIKIDKANKIVLDRNILQNVFNSILNLIKEFEEAMIQKKYFPKTELM